MNPQASSVQPDPDECLEQLIADLRGDMLRAEEHRDVIERRRAGERFQLALKSRSLAQIAKMKKKLHKKMGID
jgi:hypothetical protein